MNEEFYFPFFDILKNILLSVKQSTINGMLLKIIPEQNPFSRIFIKINGFSDSDSAGRAPVALPEDPREGPQHLQLPPPARQDGRLEVRRHRGGQLQADHPGQEDGARGSRVRQPDPLEPETGPRHPASGALRHPGPGPAYK